MTALHPCPFCAKSARVVKVRVAEDAMATWVECTKCHARTDQVEDAYPDPDTAAGLWNVRWGSLPPCTGEQIEAGDTAREISLLTQRILEIAPKAGLYIRIKIEERSYPGDTN